MSIGNRLGRASRRRAEELVVEFNKQFPVGSTVMWRSVSFNTYPHKPVTVQYKAFVADSGTPVVFFNERCGYCSIEEDFVDYGQTVCTTNENPGGTG